MASKKGPGPINVVFLLPNKEFTYYTFEYEVPIFRNFNEGLKRVLALKNGGQPVTATVLFQPFAYGNHFYDTPYNAKGERVKSKSALIAGLLTKENA